MAVIAVVLFHFRPQWLPGGFAGVDVFFVISGFLMTGLIFKGLENNTFSVLRFYMARANRIIPALAVLCLVLLVFGWFYLTPLDYRTLGKHITSSVSFLSNFAYWRESGYFDSASHQKWLLHTWSLSVEWQFYIVYPLVLLLMKRFMNLRTMKYALLVATLAAFAFSALTTWRWPDSSYFLLPARAWEMMMGGVACLFPLHLAEKNKWRLEALGFALIVLSYVFISKDNLWPGYLAMIPVLGTFLVIQANRNNSWLTANPVSSWLGKCSYSIYLWHWPLVVGLNLFNVTSVPFILAGIAASLVAGTLSYYLVEKHKLTIPPLSFKSLVLFKPAIITVVMAVTAVFVFKANGIKTRVNDGVVLAESARAPASYQYCFAETKKGNPDGYCVFHDTKTVDRTVKNKVKAIVVGDSHASSLVLSVVESLNKQTDDGDVVFYGHPVCLAISGMTLNKDPIYTRTCDIYAQNLDAVLNRYPDAKVIFANRLSVSFFGYNESFEDQKLKHIAYYQKLDDINANALDLKQRYNDMIDYAATTHEVYIVKPIPEQGVNIPQAVARSLMYNREQPRALSTAQYLQRNDFVLNMLQEIAQRSDVRLVDPVDLLCQDQSCAYSSEQKLLYYDDDHLSPWGASFVHSAFDKVWQ